MQEERGERSFANRILYRDCAALVENILIPNGKLPVAIF